MTRTRAIPGLLRDLNERTVFDLIRASAPISRAEISRRAGISKPTVSLALRSLVDAGLVRETSQVPGRPTYGAVYFEPVPEAALVLGFDLGARFLRGALSDLRGDVRARQDVEVTGLDAGDVVEAAGALRSSLLKSSALPAALVDCAIVGVPGVVSTDRGRIALPGDIPGLGDRDLGSELEERLGLDVTLENDVNLAALGEQWRGVAQDVDDFVFLSIGTGLGAGLVLDGRLHRGRNGAAGELDYSRAGRPDETDPSADAISAFAARLARGTDSALVPPYDTRSIFAA